MSASKVRVVRIDKWEYHRTYSEAEVEDILRKHTMLEASDAFDKNADKSRLYIKSNDGSTGPYKTFEVTVTREGGPS